ncbi:hypothetical protein, partial [Faecalicatena contorta]|uniref:hypothetical protein n=1 Tax=Faecalicatena contorta TaxID=39482 RepID=UPI003217D98D
PALDMQQHVLLYINQGLKAQLRTFSPPVIIEDQHLQTFLHTLLFCNCRINPLAFQNSGL